MFKDSNLSNNGNRVLKFFFFEHSDIWTIGDSISAVPQPLDFTSVFLCFLDMCQRTIPWVRVRNECWQYSPQEGRACQKPMQRSASEVSFPAAGLNLDLVSTLGDLFCPPTHTHNSVSSSTGRQSSIRWPETPEKHTQISSMPCPGIFGKALTH